MSVALIATSMLFAQSDAKPAGEIIEGDNPQDYVRKQDRIKIRPMIGGGMLISGNSHRWGNELAYYGFIDMPQHNGFSFGGEAGIGFGEKEGDNQMVFAAPRIKWQFLKTKKRWVNYAAVAALGIWDNNVSHEKYWKGGLMIYDDYCGVEISASSLGYMVGFAVTLGKKPKYSDYMKR